jgi:hypothetical protein
VRLAASTSIRLKHGSAVRLMFGLENDWVWLSF